MKFYQDNETREIIAVRGDEAIDTAGKAELLPNMTDAAQEKHVPVVSREGQTVTVTVGSAAHPMAENHYIQWVMLETESGVERRELAPGEEPAAQFFAAEDDAVLAAYAFCNLHGLWQAAL